MTENHSIGSHAAARKEPEAVAIPLVDDDPINLNALFQVLGGHDYRLLAARSGEGALKIAQRAAPILILLDVKMPGIDRYETCRRKLSPQPVFLKMGREEEFFIRIGPGSRKLTPREVITYVTRRDA